MHRALIALGATTLTTVAAALLTFVPRTSIAHACSCSPGVTEEKRFEDTVAIFSGRAVDVNVTGYYKTFITFEVDKVWKGTTERSVMLVSYEPCGYRFEEGKNYLIYARLTDGLLDPDYCLGTTPLSESGSDYALLGRPLVSYSKSDSPTLTLVIGMATLATAALASVLLRLRGHRRGSK